MRRENSNRHTSYFCLTILQSVSCQRSSLPALWVQPRKQWHFKQPYKSRVMLCHPVAAINTQKRKTTTAILFFCYKHIGFKLLCASPTEPLILCIRFILRLQLKFETFIFAWVQRSKAFVTLAIGESGRNPQTHFPKYKLRNTATEHTPLKNLISNGDTWEHKMLTKKSTL